MRHIPFYVILCNVNFTHPWAEMSRKAAKDIQEKNMMKKFIVFLCVAGVLTGCAVGGEKTTAPKQEAKTEEVQEKETEKTEQKTEEPKESA